MLAQISILAAVSIDVDITAVAMALLFIIFYYLLQPMILNRYMEARQMRTEAIEGAREDAHEDQARAEATIQKYETQMREARREAQEVRESLRNQGAEEQKEMLEAARAEVQQKLDEEREKIDKQVEEARKQVEGRADALAQAMVDKVLPGLG